MRVHAFMVPAAKVVTIDPTDTIKQALDLMIDRHIGALVVVKDNDEPLGIITKSDLSQAYFDNLPADHPVKEIMSQNLETCTENMNRDQAARVLERNHNHHAIVVNANKEYVGLISSWDIAVECAKDDRAWPYLRSEDGKFHNPIPKPPTLPVQHTTTTDDLGQSFRAYMDHSMLL